MSESFFDCFFFLYLFDQRGIGTSVAVVTTKGVFSCLVNLLPGPVDTVYDLILGRDWFNYCTTVPDAEILLPDDMRLVFSSSPFSAVCHCTGEYLS